MIDIDFFKEVNDWYGHSIGDSILARISALLAQNMRKVDLLCRYGGDEFAILMPGRGKAQAEEVARRLCRVVAEHPFRAGTESLHITLSIGLAVTGRPSDSLDDLIRRADQALYQAKQSGRNCVKTQPSTDRAP